MIKSNLGNMDRANKSSLVRDCWPCLCLAADALGVPWIGSSTDRRHWVLPSLLPVGTAYMPHNQCDKAI